MSPSILHERVQVADLVAALDRDGIVALPPLVSAPRLTAMQRAFATRLRRMRWNSSDGYERTELYRHMVEDVLVLDQGFVEIALHPVVLSVARAYVGPAFQLTEAKGWRSLPTRRDFHGWHGDDWYDQATISDIPREIKMAFYLTNVDTGAFNYALGSHRQVHAHMLKREEVEDVLSRSRITVMTGAAGTAFLFDTSGIHRQGAPILHDRQALFYSYRDPAIRLDPYIHAKNRYHPLLLNAAFLGNLTDEHHRVLGFGDTRHHAPAFARESGQTVLEALSRHGLAVKLRLDAWHGRIVHRLRRVARLRRLTGPSAAASASRASRDGGGS
jgi:hypothetical protein